MVSAMTLDPLRDFLAVFTFSRSFIGAGIDHFRIVPCAQAMQSRDGKWLEAGGLVLVRQRPGSAKGVMFITIEDETGIANLVVWVRVSGGYNLHG